MQTFRIIFGIWVIIPLTMIVDAPLHPATFTWTQVSVGGEAGWMVEPIPARLAWRIVFVQHNGSLFRLFYWPVDIIEAKADLDELTQTTLGSFAFTK